MSDDSHRTDLSSDAGSSDDAAQNSSERGSERQTRRTATGRRSQGRVARSTAGRVSRSDSERSNERPTRSSRPELLGRSGRPRTNPINYSVIEFLQTEGFDPADFDPANIYFEEVEPDEDGLLESSDAGGIGGIRGLGGVGGISGVGGIGGFGSGVADGGAGGRGIGSGAGASGVGEDAYVSTARRFRTEGDEPYEPSSASTVGDTGLSSDEIDSILSSLLNGTPVKPPARGDLAPAEYFAELAESGFELDEPDDEARPRGRLGIGAVIDAAGELGRVREADRELRQWTDDLDDASSFGDLGTPSSRLDDASSFGGSGTPSSELIVDAFAETRAYPHIEDDVDDSQFTSAEHAAALAAEREASQRRSLGIGWSDYYSEDDERAGWIDDIDEDWYDLDEYYLLEEESEPLPSILIWPFVLTALAILIVLTGVLTLYVRTTEVRLEALAQQRYDAAVGTLTEAIAYIQEADVVVVSLDKALDNPVTPDLLHELENLIVQANGALQTLDSAIARAEEAKAMFDDPADQQIAQCAIDDALYKKQMLLFGMQLIQADIDAMKCAMQLDTAWELILAADSLMRDAVSTVTTGGSTQITRARDLNREALGKLDEARLALQAASDAFPEVDFSRLANYIDAKHASCELAIASDDALLERNYTRASELNNEFRTKDAEVVELARQMPEDPWVLIYDAYEDKTTAWRDEYRKLFDQAADMDAILRAWMTRGVEPSGE